MNFALKIGLSILLSLCFNLVWSQPKVDEKALAEEANALFTELEYDAAYAKYSQLVSLYGSNPLYTFRFGASSIFVTVDREKSLAFMRDAMKRGYNDAEVHYYVAKALHLNYKFSEALTEYQAFEAQADKKTLAKSDVKIQIESCKSGINLLSSIKDIQVLEKTQADKATFFRFYNVDESIGKIITTPEELKSALDKKSKEPYIIFQAQKSKLIFFASKGKDGTTGKDIYVTQRINGAFTTPEKVKGDINTNLDEDYAFLHPNGKTLYFASKGHGSMGGYDIFRSEYDATLNQFGPAINLDFAINTPDDDLLFITDAENKIAYFASSRFTSSNNLNVYRVAVDGIPMQITYIKGFLTDLIGSPSKAAHIEIIDQSTGRKVIDTRCNEQDGNFLLFIPKPGTYTYRIQLAGSPQLHEVEVEIPNLNSKLVFKQELKASKEGGREKVEIICHWNEPLQEDIATLTQMMLLTKANLEVNTTAIVSVDNHENNSNSTVTNSNEPNWNTVQNTLNSVNDKNKALQEELKALQETNEILVALVQQSLSVVDEAQEKLSSLQLTADTKDAQEMEALASARQELKIANEQTQALGKSLLQNKKDIEQISAAITNGNALAESLSAKVSSKNAVGLDEDLKKADALLSAKTASQHAKEITNSRKDKEGELNALQSELKTIGEEEIKTELQIKIEKENLASTKKKKEQELIQEKIVQLENLQIELGEDREKTALKMESKSNELSFLTQQEKIETQVEAKTLPKPLPEFRQSGKTVNQELLFKELEEANVQAQKSIQEVSKTIQTRNTSVDSSNNTAVDSSNNTADNTTNTNSITSNTNTNTTSNNTSIDTAGAFESAYKSALDPNPSIASTEAYEKFDLLARIDAQGIPLENKQKLIEIQSEIESIQTKMKSTSTVRDLKKMDKKLEELVLSRSLEEEKIQAQIITLTGYELDDLSFEIDSLLNLPNTPDSIQNNIRAQQLRQESALDEATELRRTAVGQTDPIERADTYRRAFALETEVIEENKKIRSLLQASQPYFEASKSQISTDSNNLSSNNTSSNNTSSNNTSSNNTSSNNTTSNNTSESNPSNSNNNISNNSSSNNTTSNNTTESNTSNSNNNTSNNSSSNNTTSNNTPESNTSNSNNITSNNSSSNNTNSTNTSESNTSNSNNNSSNNTSSNNTTSNNTTESNTSNSNNNTSNNSTSNSRSGSVTIPATVTSTLYGSIENNNLQPHNDSNPIPTLTSLPDGSFYTIQVGAFRRPVSNNTFTQFSPVFAEQQANGFIRYSSGFFVAYGEAKSARDAIRAMGYKDAFIVAYKNGKRVGYTAIMTTEELVSYNAGQNSSNNTNSNTSNNSASSIVSSNNNTTGSINTTYYNQEEGVSAKLIETSEGIFFTVQVGVYTRPTKNNALESLPALHVELMKNGNIRYMAGNFKTLQEASALKNELRNGSIPDAFITAYENGNRITISEAKQKLGIATE
ncbi:MAG: hypothetical protein FJX90_03450 [Bacteroidetes bacterium]|nr:hypothetical protein [Bacteroidota bacterium]